MSSTITGRTSSKWATMEALSAAISKRLVEEALSGHDFQAQQDALEEATVTARTAKRNIGTATARVSETRLQAEQARTVLVSLCAMFMASSSDRRASPIVDVARFSDGELLHVVEEFAGRATHSSAIAEGIVDVVPLVKSQFLARQAAAEQARHDAQLARFAWAKAVLGLESTLTNIRADLMVLGIVLPSRRPPQRQANGPSLAVVRPSAPPPAGSTPSVG